MTVAIIKPNPNKNSAELLSHPCCSFVSTKLTKINMIKLHGSLQKIPFYYKLRLANKNGF